MEKLTIKELAPYLPYKLKIKTANAVHLTMGGGNINLITKITDFKPILRPLSDYDPSENGFCGFESHSDFILSVRNKTLEYKYFEMLLENHFDIFGLIEKGLAIDINTLK